MSQGLSDEYLSRCRFLARRRPDGVGVVLATPDGERFVGFAGLGRERTGELLERYVAWLNARLSGGGAPVGMIHLVVENDES